MITLAITLLTVIISLACFKSSKLFTRLSFMPYDIRQKGEYGRFISHSLVHADYVHLIINMLVFFSFGRYVENRFMSMEAEGSVFSGRFIFLLLYFGGVVVASLRSYFLHRNDPYYISVGASGAVSAVLFTSIYFSPMSKIYFYGIIPMPGIVFGVLYLVYSSYMSKKSHDNINHDAHFWGAVYGFLLPVILKPSSVFEFINQLTP